MKLNNRRTLSILMAIVMVLSMIPFQPLQVRAEETPTLDLGTPVRLSETTYQLSNAAFGSTGVVNAGGGYFTVIVNNGSIAVGTLSSGITELTNGITISGVVTDKSTPANRVFNFSSDTTFEDIQAVIRNMTFTQSSGQTQSITVNVAPGAPLSNGKTSIRIYDGRYFVYVARQTTTLSFKEAVDIATSQHGHLVEPTAGNPGEMFAIASMFKEFKSQSPWAGDGGIWHFLSFIGASKTQGPNWDTSVYSKTRYVTNPNQETGLDSTLLPNGDPIHITLMLDNDVTKIGYLPVNNTHGVTSSYKDPGVIVEYDFGIINIIATSKEVASFSTGSMGGSVAISGTAQVGQTLTANLSGIIYTPNTTEDVPTYQWYRDGVAIPGATSASYELTEDDIGKPITIKVTADGIHATGSVTSEETAPVAKADGPAAPSAPEEDSKTATSITLKAVAGQEYSRDGVNWQDSPTFDGLTPGTDYTFVTRIKGTATQSPSAVSEAITIRTPNADLPLMGGVVSVSGTAKYGETLTADVTGITYTPNTTENVPTYMWYRDGVAIEGATNESYTLTEDDIGKTLTVMVIADGTHAAGSVTSAATAPVAKVEGPTAPSAPVEASKTATSITLTGIAGQEYSKDGGLTWQDSPTFNGLTPDTDYTFVTRVKATATHNSSAISEAAKIRTSVSASNGNTGGNNSGSTPTPTAPVTPTTPVTPTKPVESGIKTSVNDKDGMFATGTTSTSGDRTTTSVQVDLDKLSGILAKGTEQQLAIHSPKESDLQVGGLTADTLKQLADKGANLDISNPLAIYPVPGGKMDLNGVSKQLGNAALNDIAVHVGIARSSDTLIGSAKNKAAAEGYELITTPVDLNLTFTKDGKTVQSGQLNGYAKKYIALPEGIDPNRITTGVVINPDGSVFHVPTVVTKIDSRYYALINDLRSSGTYSVIWNPQDFEDVRYHWGRDDVNNIAARLDLKGNGDNTFSPNRSVTRSEFAEIVVTGLGLKRQDAPQANFYDVPTSVWYKDAVALANEFDIVRGYDDGNFKGEQQITREQGFAMIARAYRLIQSEDVPNLEQLASTLAPYGDGTDVASWAKADVAQLISAGIIQGNGPKLLSPKAQMTRAEVTALIARMLKVTNLIDK